MAEYRGWLLDLYPDPDKQLLLWFIGEDGRRYCFSQSFPIRFHLSGPFPRLREAWKFLSHQPVPVALSRQQRRELFSGLLDVLTVEVSNPAEQPALFQRLLRQFPDLECYDGDIPVTICYAAAYDVFPLSYCCITADSNHHIQSIQPLESRWQIDVRPVPLRLLTIQPDSDPAHHEPTAVRVEYGRKSYTFAIKPARHLLLQLQALFKRHDPDIVVTNYGDTWLFPYLREAQAAQEVTLFNPNRDPNRDSKRKQAISYHTYGHVIHKGEQAHLFGRIHIDRYNGMMFGDYGLEGIYEQARVTGLSLQEAARRSPGAGFSAMQYITALQQGILIPHRKQQAEVYKSANDLLRADRGGLVYQPEIGLHDDVAEIDFVSMYPSIMIEYNISPETVKVASDDCQLVPELGIPVNQKVVGIVPQTLRPLRDKRVAIKQRLATLNRRDCRYKPLKSRSSALKWLLVVAFGYLSYKNFRFGRIEGHEAVTAYSRDALLRAKETAEAAGFRVLHMYVDGLWVKKRQGKTADFIQSLLAEITAATRLPIELEGIYNWIAFLPSRSDPRVPVPNRYFGAFEDRSLKMRGIETRRHDTPPFIAHMQRKILHIMSAVPTTHPLHSCLPAVFRLLDTYLAALRDGRLPIQQLVVTQTLSRAVAEYRVPSPAARAALQLEQVGKGRQPGQRIKYFYTIGDPGVYAYDHPLPLDRRTIDTQRYVALMVRAAANILQPLAITETDLHNILRGGGHQLPLPLKVMRPISFCNPAVFL